MPAAANQRETAVIAVYVTPRAGRDEIAGEREGALWVKLTAPPVQGAANEALVRFLAGRLGVPRHAVTLLSGETGRRKRLRVDGFDAAAVREKLARGSPSPQ
jgi:uncharacterized protein (TIGR00251 family)